MLCLIKMIRNDMKKIQGKLHKLQQRNSNPQPLSS